MAVLVEAYSVIVRRDSIDSKFTDGWQGFRRTVPNGTLCTEGELARVGFMDSEDACNYVEILEQNGLMYLKDGKAVDIVVCDQIHGPHEECEWIEYGRLPFEGENKISAAWLYEGRRIGTGLHFKSLNYQLAIPSDWQFEGSLSDTGQFSEPDDFDECMEFLRVENGVEVYWNKNTNKEVYVGKPYS